MNVQLLILIFIFFKCISLYSQDNCENFYSDKFSQKELKEDLNFIKSKLLKVHINTYNKINSIELENKFSIIESEINGEKTAKEFLELTKSVFYQLNDEHGSINSSCLIDSIRKAYKIQKANQKTLTELYIYENYT